MMINDYTSVGFLHSLQRHSDGAWSRLNDIYLPLIRKWLRQYSVNAADADDISQDVILVVFRRLSDFERERSGSFRCWLRCITVNCLRDYRRKSARQIAGEGVRDLLEGLEDPESDLSRRWNVEHDMHVLRYLMSELQNKFSQQTWQAFQRTALSGQRPSEVAAELKMSENAVCIAKSRVSSRIREMAKGLL